MLEDVVRYRDKIIEKYSKYLKIQDIKELMNKMIFVESELRDKLDTFSYDAKKEMSFGKAR